MRDAEAPSIFLFLAAAALAISALDRGLAVGGGVMAGLVVGPPFGWIPLAFIRRS